MNKERAGSLFFLFTGIYGLILSINLPLGSLNAPGPGILPLCLSILLCLSGVFWLILGKGTDREKAGVDWGGIFRNLLTPLKIMGLCAAFVFTFTLLGYLLASAVYLFATFLWVSRFKWWASMGLAVGIGGGSWYFFGKVLAVQLPQGLLPF